VSGLTPTFQSLQIVETTVSVAFPAISEIGNGWYRFTLTPAVPLVGVIDGGIALPGAERYQPVSIQVLLDVSSGSAQITLVLNDTINFVPIPDVEIVVLNEDESLLVNSGVSNSMGQLLMQLTPGQYVIRIRKDGYNFSTPQTLVVVGNATVTYNGTQVGDVAADYRSIVVPRDP